MNIDNLTLGEIKKLQSLFSKETAQTLSESHPFDIGKQYFIRTVTHYFTGKLEAVYPQEFVFSSVSWIADTGRYSDALKDHSFNEVEPYPDGDVIIGRGSLIDMCEFTGTLPRSKK